MQIDSIKSIYKSIAVSDEEPDEKLYTVYHAQKTSEPLFLTISSNYIREKDALTERWVKSSYKIHFHFNT